jgi:hypothetical protein
LQDRIKIIHKKISKGLTCVSSLEEKNKKLKSEVDEKEKQISASM